MKAMQLNDQFAEQLRRIIREEVRPMIREEVVPIIREEVRPIIREETQDIRDDVALIKQVQITQGMQLRAMKSDIRGLKTGLQTTNRETSRLAILLEDLEMRFSAGNEAYGL